MGVLLRRAAGSSARLGRDRRHHTGRSASRPAPSLRPVMTPRSLVVLALDNDRPLLDMYRALFAEHGHGVRQARNAIEARDMMDLDVDVVVVDLHSPESQGDDFLSLLRDESGLRDTP